MSIGYALLWGFVAFWGVLLIVSNLFKDHTLLWFISAGIAGIATTIFALLDLSTPLYAMLIGIAIIACLLALVKWLGSI